MHSIIFPTEIRPADGYELRTVAVYTDLLEREHQNYETF